MPRLLLPSIKQLIVSKKLVLLAVLVLIHSILFAQNGKVTGKVLNSKNEPLNGVSVNISGASGGTTTNIEGVFTLNLPAGKKYTLVFTAVGYTAKTIDEVEIAAGKVNELNIVDRKSVV